MDNTPPPKKYQIRQLDWIGVEPAIALGLGVQYMVSQRKGPWCYDVTFGDCTDTQACESLEDGKAKCQANWEALLSDYLQ